jgi:hypothetical protein
MRRALGVLLLVSVLAAIALWGAQPYVERRIADEVARAAAGAGIGIASVTFSWTGPLLLEGVTVDRPDTGRVEVAHAEVRWDYAGGRDARAHVRGFDLRGIRARRGPLTVEMNETSFDVISWTAENGVERLKLRQRPSGGEFEARWKTGGGGASGSLRMEQLDFESAVAAWAGAPILRPGRWTGRLDVSVAGGHRSAKGALTGADVRIALPATAIGGPGQFGAPVAAALDIDAVRDGNTVELKQVDARLGGIKVAGRGRLEDMAGEAALDAALSAETDLGPAFAATGLQLPAAIDLAPGAGTARLDLEVRGPLSRPAELLVVPRLQFDAGSQAIEKLQFLARPFRYRPRGEAVVVDVVPGGPDFIAAGALPPLFRSALLVSEDANFFGHPGVDVAEIPVAWAENVERGQLARGASTITQQLVKNLFLTGEKTIVRKVEEAALALLVDAALPKWRILEIYVNVIEWGPGVRGLVPAARHYFGKTPAELTPKETAFLVCLIPSPVRYHQAHSAGRAGPGMEQLMANLLAKLRSIEALDEAAYRAALEEQLAFAPETAPPPAA